MISITHYKKIYIGKDNDNNVLCKYDEKWNGSNILIQLSEKEYLFFGQGLSKIILNENVLGFYSTMGNNDCTL